MFEEEGVSNRDLVHRKENLTEKKIETFWTPKSQIQTIKNKYTSLISVPLLIVIGHLWPSYNRQKIS